MSFHKSVPCWESSTLCQILSYVGSEDTEMDETSPCPHIILSPMRWACGVGSEEEVRKPSSLLRGCGQYRAWHWSLCHVWGYERSRWVPRTIEAEKHWERQRKMMLYSMYQTFLKIWWLISTNLSGPEKYLRRQLLILWFKTATLVSITAEKDHYV